MISAVDFEDIFGWGPARARTGLPTVPTATSTARDDFSAAEAPASTYVIRDLDAQPRQGARTRELASVTA